MNFPRNKEPHWKPHTSYHASGQHHQKSYSHKVLLGHRQKPDEQFTGGQNVVTIGIASDDPRGIGQTCRASDFSDVFEIPLAELRPEKYRILVSVDLTQPRGQPVTTPRSKIIRTAVYKEATPWIHVTLFDTG